MLSCLRGYSVCIFTYGQTGTGKTYSMEVGREGELWVAPGARRWDGSPTWPPTHLQGPPEDPGIAPRALQSLFREMRTGGRHCVTLSMVEIYNEAVRSGLCPGCLPLLPPPPCKPRTPRTKPSPFSPGTF